LHVPRCVDTALDQALHDQPVLVVAKSLGTLALPWAVERGLPGVWLTPLLREAAVVTAVGEARQPTLLVGGTADTHWQPPEVAGPGVTLMELPGADHGLQQPGDWRRPYDRIRTQPPSGGSSLRSRLAALFAAFSWFEIAR